MFKKASRRTHAFLYPTRGSNARPPPEPSERSDPPNPVASAGATPATP
jgi:hypothetical protein